jgi:polynucleotide 5'-kinase involved in rRNA processing
MIDGSNVHIYKMNEETALDVLPPKIYTVRFHQLMGYYLEITKDRLEMPVKIYGTVEARVSKCVKTYMERSTSTGILLTGDKGTGKSLLMSMLANAVIDALNMPIILIKDAFTGTQFTSFIETIGECC